MIIYIIIDYFISLSCDVADWNPFGDPTPFSQMTEDQFFGAEFDRIRRGSQSSIGNVKSRESLVMDPISAAAAAAAIAAVDDPFGAAPFTHPGKSFILF